MAVLALVLLVVGGVGGFALWRSTHDHVTVTDQEDVLTVTVPRAWYRSVHTHGWNPPGSTIGEPALSVGTQAAWRVAAGGQGVFAGLFPATQLPTSMPRHPECGHTGAPVLESRGDPTITVTSTGCPGGSVVIERAMQLNGSTLLWVQVRSDDLATGRQVLGQVHARGLI